MVEAAWGQMPALQGLCFHLGDREEAKGFIRIGGGEKSRCG